MLGDKKVLLIDDEQIMHDLSHAYLDRAGYQLISAYNGKSGLRMLLSEKPDCVLLDYMMPGLDGEEVFSRIREAEEYREVRHTPVIFLTARGGDDALKKRLIQKGVIAYLQKPFGLREMSNILDNIFIVNEIRKKNRQLERQVRTTREYLSRVIQSAPVGILTTNRQGDIIEANLKFLRYFPQFSKVELKRQNVFRSDGLKDSFVAEGIAHVLENDKESRRKILRWQLPDGKHVILTARFVRLNPSADRVDVGVIGIIEDVTERERHSYELQILAQIALAMQEAMALEDLVHLMLSAITAGQVLGFSRAMLFLADESTRRLVGKMGVSAEKSGNGKLDWPNLLNEPAKLESYFRSISTRSSPYNQRFTRHVREFNFSLNSNDELLRGLTDRKAIRLRGGHSAIADKLLSIEPSVNQNLIAVPLFANDELLGMLVVDAPTADGTVDDSSLRLLTLFAGNAATALERARTYEQLAMEKSKLESAYKELKVTHDRLVQSERLAAIGEMAAHVAHEIRNPLVTIGGFARQLEKRAKVDNRENTAASIIADEVLRLEKILANVLNFSRLPNPQFRLNNINLLIQKLYMQVREEFASKRITLKLSLQPDLPAFHFDEQQLTQVLFNLLRNSQQSISDFGMVEIQTRQNSGTISIAVQDDGDGISKTELDKIFNPFYTTKQHGTGLGLAISQQIIHDHGGSIKVTSKPDKGTIFRIELPLEIQAEEKSAEYEAGDMII